MNEINLRSIPIDVHTLVWRNIGFSLRKIEKKKRLHRRRDRTIHLLLMMQLLNWLYSIYIQQRLHVHIMAKILISFLIYCHEFMVKSNKPIISIIKAMFIFTMYYTLRIFCSSRTKRHGFKNLIRIIASVILFNTQMIVLITMFGINVNYSIKC